MTTVGKVWRETIERAVGILVPTTLEDVRSPRSGCPLMAPCLTADGKVFRFAVQTTPKWLTALLLGYVATEPGLQDYLEKKGVPAMAREWRK